jgi:hypothetical protein
MIGVTRTMEAIRNSRYSSCPSTTLYAACQLQAVKKPRVLLGGEQCPTPEGRLFDPVVLSDEYLFNYLLEDVREFLRDVKHAVRASGDSHSDMGVFGIEDVAPMVVLEFRLVHEACFGLRDI